MEAYDSQPEPFVFDSRPKEIGKIKSGGFNNGNIVYQGGYGGLFYKSKKSKQPYYLRKGTSFDLL
jgi:hypothetical protein